MAVAAYKYSSDDGTTYQVVLPTDFALALGYEAAAGTEPYLPDMISPRFASYVAPGSKIFAQAVVTSRSKFVAPPNPITVSGITYNLQSLFGEKRFAVPSGNFQVIAGPQGPPGANAPPYTPTTQSSAISNGTFGGTGFVDVFNFGSLTAGLYFMSANGQFQTGAGVTCTFGLQVWNQTDSAIITNAQHRFNIANALCDVALTAFFTLATTKNIRLQAASGVASSGSMPAGNVWLWKVT